MSLQAGDRLGAYEVIAPIGAGGMGEVYRARDTKLGRDVALKILPDTFAADAERLARFRREAQLLASLNHPHIAGIYGFEETAGVHALVLEYVDGPTLADRIARGALPLDEALPITLQIIEALDAAHTQGIVHRDLKPANIKLRPDGTVKVLDFGLAKSFDGDQIDAAHSPTVTAVSRSGLILGTAAYMSPEQARGKAVDKRADIWAFGCVLYEMLTGASAFAGETTTDTLSAIVSRDPDWTRLPPAAPAGARRLLQHTLEKDPKRRLRDIGDARLYLQSAAEGPDTAKPASRAWQVLAGVATLAAAALAVMVWQQPKIIAPPDRPLQLARLTSDSGFTTEPSLSADGRIVAYASDRAGGGNLEVWVQQTAGGGAVRLTDDPTDDRAPDVSPDGTRIAFRSDRGGGGVYVIPTLGGDARLIAPQGRAPRFSPDGRSIAFWTGGWLAIRGVLNVRRTYLVDVNGGPPTQVATDLASSGDPVWSPDGRSLLVYGRRALSGSESAPQWWIVPIDGAASRMTDAYQAFEAAGIEVTNTDLQPFPAQWTTDGVLFAATTRDQDIRSIWRLALDAQTGRALGRPQQITMGTTFDERPAAARQGGVAFAGLTRRRLILGLSLDANAGRVTGAVQVLRSDIADVTRSTVSLDGHVIAFPRYDRDSGSVWVRDLRSGRERQVATTRRTPLNPVISGDGRWVAYTVATVDQGGNSGVGTGFVLPIEGGSPRKVCDDCELYQWLRSNRFVVMLRRSGAQVSVLEVDTGKETVVVRPEADEGAAPRDSVLASGGSVGRPLVSYDERFISFLYRRVTYVAPLSLFGAVSQRQWQPILTSERNGERTCGWSPDSRLLYFLLERDGFRCLYAIRIDPRTGRANGAVFPVAHFHDGSREWGSTGYSSAVVNGLFVFNQVGLAGNIWMLEGAGVR